MGPLKGELRLAREAFLKAEYEQAVQHCNAAIQLGPASYDAQLCVYRYPTPHPHSFYTHMHVGRAALPTAPSLLAVS